MKAIRALAILLAMGLAWGYASAQVSTATVQITVTTPLQPATVTIVPAATSVPAGTDVSVAVTVAGAAGGAAPTGSVELLGKAPGATTYYLVQTLPLVDGAVACTYPIPATAPVGVYSLMVAYGGDSNYQASPNFK